MRKLTLFSTAAVLGTAMLATAPAMAQTQRDTGAAGSGYGFDPPRGTPVTPHGQGGAGLIPPVGQQYDAARRVQGDSASREVTALLRQADQALARGNTGVANEYLERAETTLLNSHAGASTESGAMATAAPMRPVSEARQALMRRDRAEARRQVQMAMEQAGRADSMSGGSMSGGGAMPATSPGVGGGGAMAPGGTMPGGGAASNPALDASGGLRR